MEIPTENKDRLASNLQNLPAEQIKKAVIKLLSRENIELIDWEYELSLEIAAFQEWIKDQRGTKKLFFEEELMSRERIYEHFL